jgi:Uma2 family endonuclease
MATSTAVSIEEYLSTVYEPDMDYVDGELEDRNVGEYDHNVVQKRILFWFDRRTKEWRIRAVQEQRTRVAPSKFRIPDVSVFARDLPVEQVFTRPQLIAVEVLSPEDRHSRMDEKIRNYIDFGVPNIWVVDAAARVGWDCSDGNWLRKERFEVSGSPIYLSLPELFAELDEAEKG